VQVGHVSQRDIDGRRLLAIDGRDGRLDRHDQGSRYTDILDRARCEVRGRIEGDGLVVTVAQELVLPRGEDQRAHTVVGSRFEVDPDDRTRSRQIQRAAEEGHVNGEQIPDQI